MTDTRHLEGIARDRSQVYWLLSDFYTTRPEAGFLVDLGARVSALGNGAKERPSETFDVLRGALDQPDMDGLAARLVVEYTRLFRGLNEGYGPPPPYESVYRGSHPMGEVTIAVLGRYGEAGFEVIDKDLGPQDHIGAELKFMSLLCYDEIAAWDRKDTDAAVRGWKRQREFLDEHILRWVPEYCRRIQKESLERFYVGAALLTERAIVADSKVLDTLSTAHGAE